MHFKHTARDESHARAVIQREKLPQMIKDYLTSALDGINVYKEGVISMSAEWHFPIKADRSPYDVGSYCRCEVQFIPVND